MLELWHLLGANYVVAYKIGFTLIILGAGLASYGLGKSVFSRGGWGRHRPGLHVQSLFPCRISIYERRLRSC